MVRERGGISSGFDYATTYHRSTLIKHCGLAGSTEIENSYSMNGEQTLIS